MNVTAFEEKFKIYYYGEKVNPFSSIYALAGGQFQLPLLGRNVMLLPYLGIKGGVKVYGFTKETTVNPIIAGNLGARLNLFPGFGNLSLFIDTNTCVLFNVKDFGLDDIQQNICLGIAF